MIERTTCQRCGEDLPRWNVTPFSDPTPRYVYGDCDCPRPCCPFCGVALIGDRCWNVHCFMALLIIPIPELGQGALPESPYAYHPSAESLRRMNYRN